MSDPTSAERQRRFRARQKEKLAQVSTPDAQAPTPVAQAAPIVPGSDRLRARLTDLEQENRQLHDRVLRLESELLRIKARRPASD